MRQRGNQGELVVEDLFAGGFEVFLASPCGPFRLCYCAVAGEVWSDVFEVDTAVSGDGPGCAEELGGIVSGSGERNDVNVVVPAGTGDAAFEYGDTLFGDGRFGRVAEQRDRLAKDSRLPVGAAERWGLRWTHPRPRCPSMVRSTPRLACVAATTPRWWSGDTTHRRGPVESVHHQELVRRFTASDGNEIIGDTELSCNSSGPIVSFSPVIRAAQGSYSTLFDCEPPEALPVAARVEGSDGGWRVGFVVPQGRSMGQI